MKDIIQDRLNRISGLNDRRLMKNILYDVYENVVAYNMDMYARLENRIYHEIDDPLVKFYIYTCLDTVQAIDPVNDFLHPMIPSDAQEAIYDMDEINEKLRNGEELVLASIFMACSHKEFEAMLAQKRTYKGQIRTDKDVHEVSVTMRQCDKYIREIERLYRVFQHNGVEWITVNCPYAYKFADIVLNSALKIKTGERITEIVIDLAEYDQYKKINTVPLWNVKQIAVSDKSFPMPALDRINYDHVVSLEEFGVQNGYLAGLDNTDYIYCKRLANDLVIVSANDQQHDWNILQIENISNARRKNYLYEITSNKRELGFIGRYASVKSMIIRTKGEIARLIESYEMSREFDFLHVEIRESYDTVTGTFNLNAFIDDNIRVDAYKKVMLLTFRSLGKENFLTQDKMSFLISEMQILFPEYRCVGVLT